MRKHILISSGSLKIGGVERLLIEYLNNIDKKRFKITLILMSDFGEKAILKNELNNDINVKYLKSSDIIEKKASLYKKKKNHHLLFLQEPGYPVLLPAYIIPQRILSSAAASAFLPSPCRFFHLPDKKPEDLLQQIYPMHDLKLPAEAVQ